MLNSWTLFVISTGYVALLFGVAYIGDRRARNMGPPARKPWIYSLALCVYCTSWTFYGAVGRAASSGWDFLPIYLGPVLVFLFGGPFLRRVIRISKRHNITSIADFIGARYGRHQSVAMLVTAIAVVGVLPYIALQLKAVSFGFEVLAGVSSEAPRLIDGALTIALMLAAFAILFGTRDLVSTENHHGMVLAIAFESLVKLGAFLAVGLYAVYGLRDGLIDAYEHALLLPQVTEPVARWRMADRFPVADAARGLRDHLPAKAISRRRGGKHRDLGPAHLALGFPGLPGHHFDIRVADRGDRTRAVLTCYRYPRTHLSWRFRSRPTTHGWLSAHTSAASPPRRAW